MTTLKVVLWIFFLSIFDAVIPLPLFGFAALYVVLRRPPWFLRLAQDVYRGTGNARNVTKKRR